MTLVTRPAALPPFAALRQALAHGDLTPLELVDRCLSRIAERESDVGAWACVDADGARRQAAALTRRPRGPLYGMPVGIKDIIDVAGLPTAYGASGESRIAARDAVCVARLRTAGAIIVGKTATTEYATWTPAQTRNPLALWATPGGSSCGSAAAVADGMVPLALGTQTVGSTIRPASFCGVFALKPSHGLATLQGALVHSDRLDTLGVFAADRTGLAAAWRTIADRLPAEPVVASPPRIGVVPTPWWNHAHRSAQDAVRQAAARFDASGAHVAEAGLGERFRDLPESHLVITEHDVARNLAALPRDSMSPALGDLVERGLGISTSRYAAAVETVRAAQRELAAAWRRHDVLLAPAVVGEAPPFEEGTGDATFCQPWSALGTPVATYPAGQGPHGLPIGVQVITAHGRDLDLIDLLPDVR